MTDQCQCQPETFPFECARHGCMKTEHWWELCQNRTEYFRLWEEGRGPGQPLPEGPGLLQKAVNYGKAVAKHVSTGRKTVTEDVLQARLDTCRGCSSLDREKMVCREKSCGCFVEKKARWASQQCPLGKWPAPEIETQTNDSAPEQNDSGTVELSGRTLPSIVGSG